MAVTASPALAQNSNAFVCGTQSSGNSWGVNGGNEVAATRFTKKPPGCLDFNEVFYQTDTGANDSFEGLF